MWISRVASLIVAASYVICLLAAGALGWDGRAVILGVALALPLALIWFPDAFGSYLGPAGRGGHIDRETPPALVVIAGWFFLVGLPLVVHLLTRNKG
jgi:hypothetical protein